MLPPEVWTARQAAHEDRADRLTAAHRARAAGGVRHPVEDFLFTYYSLRPGQLRRWHPGVGVTLADVPADDARRGWRWYAAGSGGDLHVDVAALLADQGRVVRATAALLRATASRPPHLGCFGLHEWAMVYRRPAEAVRHADWPLRLGSRGTDEVVESHRLRCSHVDAFRFFTDDAVPRNELQPTRATQVDLEQPGCLHATMDLYQAAFRLGPAVPGELLLDCLELARDVRTLDMRASPYDLSALGYSPVAIETPQGKAEYVRAQRGFAVRAAPLRAALLAVCDTVLAGEGPPERGAGQSARSSQTKVVVVPVRQSRRRMP